MTKARRENTGAKQIKGMGMKIRFIEDFNEEENLIQAMKDNEDIQDDAYLGPFWYDADNKELYGVVKALAEDCPWYKNNEFNTDVRTGRALHQAIWKKESFRGKDSRFTGDYRFKPRGRVFEFKDRGYVICVGNWIDANIDAIEEIMFEFNLPEDKTKVLKNTHWDIGHGWSKEF